MKKRTLLCLSIVLTSFLATACSSDWLAHRRDLENQPAVCKKIKRQIIYNTMNRNTEAAWQTPHQRARLGQLYKEYGCK